MVIPSGPLSFAEPYESCFFDPARRMMPPRTQASVWPRPMSSFPPDSFIVAEVVPSPNHDERKQGRVPDMILLHYTGMQTGEAALQRLCAAPSKVSSHYLV